MIGKSRQKKKPNSAWTHRPYLLSSALQADPQFSTPLEKMTRRKRTLHNQLQMVSQPTVLLAAHTNEPLLWLLRRETEEDEGTSRQNRHDSRAPTLPEMKAHGRNVSLASAPTSHAGWVAAQLASSSHQPGLQKRLLRRPPAELPAKRASQLPGQPSRPQLPPRISMRYAG